jgi:predicted LPLAT superfamily acyltransferase
MSDEWATRPERSTLWVMQLYAWVSLRAGRAAGRLFLPVICLYFLLFARKARQASIDYLTHILGRAPGWRARYRHFFRFASVVHDRLFLSAGQLARFDMRIEGEAHVRGALANGRGLILLGAHFGSFEVLRAGLAAREALPPLNVLMYVDNAANSNRIFDNARSQGVNIIPLGRPDSLMRAMECLQRGEMLGILGDRTLGQDKIVRVPFMGAPAAFPQAPWLLANLSQAPVVLFFGVYEGGNRYTIRFDAFADRVDLPRGQRSEHCASLAARFAQHLEAQCRNSPYNWFNFYAFWQLPD